MSAASVLIFFHKLVDSLVQRLIYKCLPILFLAGLDHYTQIVVLNIISQVIINNKSYLVFRRVYASFAP